MKKLLSIIIITVLGCAILSKEKTNAKQFSIPLVTLDTTVQKYVDSIGDCPIYFQTAINNLIVGRKAIGTFSVSDKIWLFPPSQDQNKPLLEFNSLTFASWNPVVTSPYATNLTTGGNDGVQFATNSNTTGFIKTGFIPSSNWQLYNTAWAYITNDNSSVGHAGYNFGALQSNTQRITFDDRDASNHATASFYQTTGQLSQTSANGATGIYIGNCRSSSNSKLWKNGSVIASSTIPSGTLPTTELYLNCQNANGVASTKVNKTISAICFYANALTDAQVIQEDSLWQRFIIDAQRTSNYKYSVVFDGNSHMVEWRSKMYRQLQYSNAGNNDSTKYFNVATAGKTTAQLLSRIKTNTDVLFNSSYTKNILVFWEGTNDIGAGVTANTAYNNIVKYCDSARVAGFKVILMEPMSRYYSGNLTYILRTDSLNTMLNANWNSFADKYIQASSNFFIPRANYSSDAAYKTAVQTLTNTFYDGIHLTEIQYSTGWSPKIRLTVDSVKSGL